MKYVTNRPVAQGDMLIIPVSEIPASAKAAKPEGAHFILAHSESGHNHVIERAKAEVYEAADDSFVAYIRTLGDGAEIKHQRSYDTHESYMLEPNKSYQVRRQREYIMEGFRPAQD